MKTFVATFFAILSAALVIWFVYSVMKAKAQADDFMQTAKDAGVITNTP